MPTVAPQRSLLRSTVVVSGCTFLSRLLGLARDILMTTYFRTDSGVLDAFNMAFRIPNLFRRLFGEGAFSQAFVPVFGEVKQTQSHQQLKLLVAQVSGSLGLALLLLSVLGMVFAPQWVWLFASGFSQDPIKLQLTIDLLRITFPYVFFICLAALVSGALNSCGRFAVPALVPTILNTMMIIAVLISGYFDTPIKALAWGVLLAGVLQLLVQLPFLGKENLLSWPKVAFGAQSVKKILLLMGPAVIGSSSAQINILINAQLASYLPTGSVTWLYVSDRFVEFALGAFAVALGTVVLPRLSQLHAQTDHKAFSETLDWGLQMALLMGIPATLGLLILSQPIVATFFLHGAFTVYDTQMAAWSLSTFGSGLAAFFLIKVLAPAFYARQNTKLPVRCGLIAISFNIVLQFILVGPLLHAGLALSSALAAWLNAGLLFFFLRRQAIYHAGATWRRFSYALAWANILMVMCLLPSLWFVDFWFTAHFGLRLTALIVLVLFAMVVYGLGLFCAGLRPKQFMR